MDSTEIIARVESETIRLIEAAREVLYDATLGDADWSDAADRIDRVLPHLNPATPEFAYFMRQKEYAEYNLLWCVSGEGADGEF